MTRSPSETYRRLARSSRRLAWMWLALAAFEGLLSCAEFVIGAWVYGIILGLLACSYVCCWWLQRGTARVQQETADILAKAQRFTEDWS